MDFISAPVILAKTDVAQKDVLVSFSCFSITDSISPLFFEVEFYDLNNNFIESYDESSGVFDKPGGYESGEVAIFVLPYASLVMGYDNVKFRIRGKAGISFGSYGSFSYMGISDLTMDTPELISCNDDDSPVFRWMAATEINPEELNYTLEIYSLTSSLSALVGASGLEHYSILSALEASGLLHLLYADSGISGCSGWNYWELMSNLSVGSYLVRLGAMDNASHMVWSLFEAFVMGSSKTVLLKPGFNLYSIPLRDSRALTARQLIENLVGYYDHNTKPYVSEMVRFEDDVNQKTWRSIAASISGYNLTDDFDFEGNRGYFINLNYPTPIAIVFRGEVWL